MLKSTQFSFSFFRILATCLFGELKTGRLAIGSLVLLPLLYKFYI